MRSSSARPIACSATAATRSTRCGREHRVNVRHAAKWAYAQYLVNGLLPLLLLPYLTRTLSAGSFAQLVYFQSASAAVGLAVDFGLGQGNLGRLVRSLGDRE